jgi:hypothetical protein
MNYQQLAYAVRNHVSDGLKGVSNISYSIEQIIDEAILLRNKLLFDKSTTFKVNLKFFTQTVPKIAVNCEKFYGHCSINIDEVEMHFEIPKPLYTSDDSGIYYLGPMDNSTNFKVYFDNTYNLHKYRLKTKHKPFVFVDLGTESDTGHVRAFLMNAGDYKELKYMTVRAAFENPRLASVAPNFYLEEFHATSEMQSMIIDQLTMKYVEYYRKLNHLKEPNTQTSLNS